MDDAQFGSAIRAVRLRRGLTQAEIASAARVSRPIVSLIERGGAEETTVRTLRRVASVLGISVAATARWRGVEMAKLLDESHARLVRSVVEKLLLAGWTARPEHTFSVWGERGSVDVLAWRPGEQAILCLECKTRLPDLQDLLSTMDRKRRLARDIARLEGWRPTVGGSVLVLPEQTWARNAVRKSRSVFEAALPARRNGLSVPGHAHATHRLRALGPGHPPHAAHAAAPPFAFASRPPCRQALHRGRRTGRIRR